MPRTPLAEGRPAFGPFTPRALKQVLQPAHIPTPRQACAKSALLESRLVLRAGEAQQHLPRAPARAQKAQVCRKSAPVSPTAITPFATRAGARDPLPSSCAAGCGEPRSMAVALGYAAVRRWRSGACADGSPGTKAHLRCPGRGVPIPVVAEARDRRPAVRGIGANRPAAVRRSRRDDERKRVRVWRAR